MERAHAASGADRRSVRAGRGRVDRIGVVGMLAALWAALPPYAGPELATDATVEVVDHVVPGVVVLLVSAAVVARRPSPSTVPMFSAGLVVALAGLWMTATHVPLIRQASQGEAPWGSVIWHATPAAAVLVLGAAWAALHAGGGPSRARRLGT